MYKSPVRDLLATWLIDLGAPWWALPDSNVKRLAYYRSWQWKRKVDQVRDRAGGLCEWCRRAGWVRPGREVHHLTYRRLFFERLSDLVLLCRYHHAWVHRRVR